MTAIRQAQQIFDAGVLSLGLMVDGRQAAKDLDYAKAAFRRATELDPEMCDAWLGRAAAGELTREVLFNLHKTCASALLREQRRLGLPFRQLAGRFQIGQCICSVNASIIISASARSHSFATRSLRIVGRSAPRCRA